MSGPDASDRLSAQGLGLRVGESPDGARWLVRALDLTLVPGVVTAIVGPNGAGKSTLLRTLAGLRTPDEGRLRLGERALEAWAPRARAKQIAYLPQSTPLVHDLRTQEVVGLGRAPWRGRFGTADQEAQQRVATAMERVGATELHGRRMSTLSGGERQRVMLARMLATGARVLLLDEPATALDVAHALSLLELLQRLADEGAAIAVALHDLDAARRHAGRAVCLDRRQGDGAHEVGPSSEVLAPDVLAAVFGVRVRDVGGVLQFRSAEP